MMRSEKEVREMFHSLGEETGDPTQAPVRGLEELPLNAWESDTFKFGFLAGKIAALAWMLGDHGSAAHMNAHFDFEDYRREMGAPPDQNDTAAD